MSESADTNRWGILGVAGVLSLCCAGTATLVGGAAVTGGSLAGATVVNETIGGVAGLLVTMVVTALPLVAIGVALHYRSSHQ